MNSLKEFENQLKTFTDNELYLAAKSTLDVFISSDYFNKKKLELIYNECQTRNKNIYKKAIEDTYLTLFFTDGKITDSERLNIQRIDFMCESEIIQLVHLIRKSSKIGNFNIASADEIDFYNLIGVPKKYLVIFKVSGDSMIDEGISDGDIVIADRRVQNIIKKLVIVEYKGELFIKRLIIEKGLLCLISANEKIKPFQLNGREEIKIIARVKNLIKIFQ